MDSRAKDLIDRQQELMADRVQWEERWQKAAEYCLPAFSDFQTVRAKGPISSPKVYDSTARGAVRRFASAVEAAATPQHQQYQVFHPEDEALEGDEEILEYAQALGKTLFRNRYMAKSGFTANTGGIYEQFGVFGNACMYIEDIPGRGATYIAMPLRDTFIATDAYGYVDTIYRRFELTVKQARQMFGDDVPPIVKKAKSDRAKHWFLHCVKPADYFDNKMLGRKGQRFGSCYVGEQDRVIIREGGYYSMPYIFLRDIVSPGEDYAQSIALDALPDVLQLNAVERSTTRQIEKMADPTLLLSEDAALEPFNLNNGAMNYGYLSDRGDPLVQALETGARPDLSKAFADQKRDQVKDSFWGSLFLIALQNPNMSATEILQRAQERGELIAPTMGQIHGGFLAPMSEREIDIHHRAGRLPPMPQKLIERGGRVRFVHDTQVTRAQKFGDAIALQNSINQLTPLANIKGNEKIMRVFDPYKAGRGVADINGVPAKWLRTIEELQGLDEQEASDAQAQNLLAAAPIAASAAKDLAQAEALSPGQPLLRDAEVFG